jgi:hypothetical protein
MRIFAVFSFSICLLLLGCKKEDIDPIRIISREDLIGTWKINSLIVNDEETFNITIPTTGGTFLTDCGLINYQETYTFTKGIAKFDADDSCDYNGTQQEASLDETASYNVCNDIYDDFVSGFVWSPFHTSTWSISQISGVSQITTESPTYNIFGDIVTSIVSFDVVDFNFPELTISGPNIFCGRNVGEQSIITLRKQ